MKTLSPVGITKASLQTRPRKEFHLPGGVAAVPLYRLAYAARRFRPHAGAAMQNAIQSCDTNPRLPGEILQRKVSRGRFHFCCRESNNHF